MRLARQIDLCTSVSGTRTPQDYSPYLDSDRSSAMERAGSQHHRSPKPVIQRTGRDRVDRLLDRRRVIPAGRSDPTDFRHQRQLNPATHVSGIGEIDDPVAVRSLLVDQLPVGTK